MPEPAPSANTNTRSLVLVWLLTSLGVPGALVAYFKESIAEHKSLAIAFGVFWLILSFSVGLISGILVELRQRTEKHISAKLVPFVIAFIDRYYRTYIRWIASHQYVKNHSGGYQLKLDDVFVDLRLETKSFIPHSSKPFEIRKNIEGRNQIWDYLKSPLLSDRPLVIIGMSGSGKTTLLEEMALRVAKRRVKIKQTLPVVMALSEVANFIKENSSISLENVVLASLAQRQGPKAPEGWFEGHLNDGDCLILMDGLDEIADTGNRQLVANWINNQVKRYNDCRFILSSRPDGYRDNTLDGAAILEMQSLTRLQVQHFVEKWYVAIETMEAQKSDDSIAIKAQAKATDLLRRIAGSRVLSELSVNPLLLGIIAAVHRSKGKLSGSRVELYSDICDVWLDNKQYPEILPANNKKLALQELAYAMMNRNVRTVAMKDAIEIIRPLLQKFGLSEEAGKDVLEEIRLRNTILQQEEAGSYTFAHLSLQSYFAAVCIKEQGLVAKLVDVIEEDWWTDVIRLYGAQEDISSILAVCLSRPTIYLLTLAIDCIDEAEVSDEWRTRLNDLITRGLEEREDRGKFLLAAETLLSRRIKNMVFIDNDLFMDTTYVTNAEFQVFSYEVPFHWPYHWPTNRFLPGIATEPIVGLRGADAVEFCSWLSRRDGAFKYRLPKRLESDSEDIKKSSPSLGYWVIPESPDDTPIFEIIDESAGFLLPELSYASNLISKDIQFGATFPYDKLQPKKDSKGKQDEYIDIRRVFSLFSDMRKDQIIADRSLGLIINEFRDSELALKILSRRKNHFPNLDQLSKLNNPLILGPALSFDRAMARNRDLGRDWAGEFARKHNIDAAINTGHILDRISLNALDRGRSISDREIFIWAVRVLALALTSFTESPICLRALQSELSDEYGIRDYLASLKQNVEVIYHYFFLLQARIDGKVTAFEGLRIVKEAR